jgi:hypothetical protein
MSNFMNKLDFCIFIKSYMLSSITSDYGSNTLINNNHRINSIYRASSSKYLFDCELPPPNRGGF